MSLSKLWKKHKNLKREVQMLREDLVKLEHDLVRERTVSSSLMAHVRTLTLRLNKIDRDVHSEYSRPRRPWEAPPPPPSWNTKPPEEKK